MGERVSGVAKMIHKPGVPTLHPSPLHHQTVPLQYVVGARVFSLTLQGPLPQ